MRRQRRRDSAREWIRSGARVTIGSYARRYGVDHFTAYNDLTAIGFELPASEQRRVDSSGGRATSPFVRRRVR
jgi:hypothetical protein